MPVYLYGTLASVLKQPVNSDNLQCVHRLVRCDRFKLNLLIHQTYRLHSILSRIKITVIDKYKETCA